MASVVKYAKNIYYDPFKWYVIIKSHYVAYNLRVNFIYV